VLGLGYPTIATVAIVGAELASRDEESAPLKLPQEQIPRVLFRKLMTALAHNGLSG